MICKLTLSCRQIFASFFYSLPSKVKGAKLENKVSKETHVQI